MAAPPYKKNYTLKPLEGQEAFSKEGGLFCGFILFSATHPCFVRRLFHPFPLENPKSKKG
jgi:hypothetical protein